MTERHKTLMMRAVLLFLLESQEEETSPDLVIVAAGDCCQKYKFKNHFLNETQSTIPGASPLGINSPVAPSFPSHGPTLGPTDFHSN